MYSNNPRSDKFLLQLPREFWAEEIMEKYDNFVNLQPHVLVFMRDIIEQEILGVSLPPFAQETPSQTLAKQAAMWDFQHPNPSNETSLISDKTIDVTIRHTEGYLTYSCMLELFYYWFNKEHKDQIFGSVPVHILNESDEIIATWDFQKVIFKSIDGLDFKYPDPTTDFFDFKCSFVYNDFDIRFELPIKESKL